MHILILFSASSNSPDGKEDMNKGQISDVLYNSLLIPSLLILGKIKSRDKFKKKSSSFFHLLHNLFLSMLKADCSRY